MRITRSFYAILLLAATIAGCGGGGSGSTSTPSNPQAPATAAPAPYTFSPAVQTASAVEGYPTTVDFNGKQAVTFTGAVYVSAVSDSAVFDPALLVQVNPDGNINIQAKTSATSKAGHYKGNITVSVCQDPKCASQVRGSPFRLPYEIDVISAGGTVTTFNLSPLSAMPGAADWGTFQANAAHTGYVPVTLNANAFSTRWKLDIPAVQGVQRVPSDVATGGGHMFTSYGTGGVAGKLSFIAYKEADGSIEWSADSNEYAVGRANPPAYANGKLYVVLGTSDGAAMFGVDVASGTQVFNAKMGVQGPAGLAPTVYGDRVYAFSATNIGNTGALYSIGAIAGDSMSTGLPNFDGWTPAIDAQGMYAYLGGQLYVMDTLSGRTRAVIDDPKRDWNGFYGTGAPVIGSGGLVFAGNFGGQRTNAITAYDTLASTARWSTLGSYSGSPAYADGTIYGADNSAGHIIALKESNGSMDWRWPCPAGETFVSDVLLTNNLVFASTDQATYAIDRASHQLVWSYRASGSLALSANGILYIKGKTSITAINLH